MLTESDFTSIMDNAEDEFMTSAIKFMTSYSAAGVQPRDTFTANVFNVMQIVFGNNFNQSGSFLTDGAKKALDDEVKVNKSSLRMSVDVFWRMKELERGDVNFVWFEKLWKKIKGVKALKSHKTLINSIDRDLGSGKHQHKRPKRPYIGLAMREGSKVLEKGIDELLLKNPLIKRK